MLFIATSGLAGSSRGLGHGHALDDTSVVEPAPESEAEHRHKADRGNLTQSIEVTDANVASFHFHGSESEFPLTAIIAVPKTDKAGTLLLGPTWIRLKSIKQFGPQRS